MYGYACDAYTEERVDLAKLLEQAAKLADECNFWFAGRAGVVAFRDMAKWLKARVAEEVE